MGQKRYCITEDDYGAAVCYLHNRLEDPGRWLERERIDRDAGESAETIASAAYECRTALALNAWAERYLSSKQWRNLKMAIRNSRRRNRGVNIEISSDALDLLRREQRHTGKTYTEIIIELLEGRDDERERRKELEQQKRP